MKERATQVLLAAQVVREQHMRTAFLTMLVLLGVVGYLFLLARIFIFIGQGIPTYD